LTRFLRQQRTISSSVRVEGFGYWSGKDVTVEFRPAAVDTGLRFVRADLSPVRRIAANAGNRIEVPRRTCLRDGDATVEMVEHVLAALAGLQIDNCEIWVTKPEMPGCDGSCLPFVQALDRVERVRQPAVRPRISVPRTIRVGNHEVWAEARPAEAGEFSVECRINYGEDCPIGRQQRRLNVTPASFRRELAGARTFLLESEAEWLRSQGLGTRATCRDLLVFGPQGPLDNDLRFPDECVRHKAMDMVGDLALAGCDLSGHFVGHCSGHRLNAALVQAVLKAVGAQRDPRRIA
jgi:UDP-3-O-acyl N-acetylglucosamine deacetylase